MKALSNETDTAFTTIQKYLSILEETYVIKLVPPYSHSTSVEISKNPKIYFYDSGLLSILWLNNFQDTIIGNVFKTKHFYFAAAKRSSCISQNLPCSPAHRAASAAFWALEWNDKGKLLYSKLILPLYLSITAFTVGKAVSQ